MATDDENKLIAKYNGLFTKALAKRNASVLAGVELEFYLKSDKPYDEVENILSRIYVDDLPQQAVAKISRGNRIAAHPANNIFRIYKELADDTFEAAFVPLPIDIAARVTQAAQKELQALPSKKYGKDFVSEIRLEAYDRRPAVRNAHYDRHVTYGMHWNISLWDADKKKSYLFSPNNVVSKVLESRLKSALDEVAVSDQYAIDMTAAHHHRRKRRDMFNATAKFETNGKILSPWARRMDLNRVEFAMPHPDSDPKIMSLLVMSAAYDTLRDATPVTSMNWREPAYKFAAEASDAKAKDKYEVSLDPGIIKQNFENSLVVRMMEAVGREAHLSEEEIAGDVAAYRQMIERQHTEAVPGRRSSSSIAPMR